MENKITYEVQGIDLVPVDPWITLEQLIVDDTINQIHCDTRDFCCLVHKEALDMRDGRQREIKRCLSSSGYQIKADKVIDWLKSLKEMSGGEGEWRMLNFKGVDCENWLKYIRLYRNPKDRTCFIVCNQNNIPITYDCCIERNLMKDQLNLMKS